MCILHSNSPPPEHQSPLRQTAQQLFPQADYMFMHYKSPYIVHQPAAWLMMFISAHVQYSFEAFVQFVFYSVYKFIVFFFTSLLYDCIYVAP